MMGFVEVYTRWVMREVVELDTLSEWVKSIKSFLIHHRIHKVKFCVNARPWMTSEILENIRY